ncbi:Protein F59H6.5 [Aphelenchoides avenae]|nr:Protein F59H6.5 [Aphelenchus avenae]
MAIVQRFGKPQLFITMTANIGWREVEEACTYYVSEDPSDPTVRSTAAPGFIEKKLLATNRMDVVVRVFDLKKDALLKKITQGKFFGTHVAHVYTIEFQKRGNPHMHLLVTLDEASAPKTPADVDRMTRAVIPDRRHEPELFDLVKKHHIHGPCDMGDCVCLDDQGRCTKKFPKAFRNEAALGEDGYAEPARPDSGPCIEYANGRVAHNGFVVPYNPELLLEFNCHTNVELCGGIRFVNYVYKYIHKQLDSAHLEVIAEGTLNADEIKRYIDCRYVSPQEAVWRLFEKAVHGRSHSVFVLHVHQRHERIRVGRARDISRRGRKICPGQIPSDAFFRLNQVDRAARSLYYYEVPEHYKWDAKDGKWVARTRASKTIGRLCNVDVRCSERFHLRLLLLHVKGPRNYDDLKVVDGRYYRTYAEACVARGLARDDMEWHACMTDAANWRLARQLRHLFVLILAWNSPKDPLALWNDFKEAMSVDFVRYHGMSQERAEQAAYAEIVDELAEYGKSLSDFPTLPKLVRPPAIDDEVVDGEEALRLACEFYRKLTNEQQAIVHRVMLKLGMEAAGIAAGNKRVRPREGDGIFMDGPGGSGKSFTYWCIFHACRAYGFNVVVMASTGAAAILLPTGSTAHQAAGLPVPLFNDCTANPRGARLRKFANADVFIWDEAPMSPRYATEAVDQRLRELHGKDEPFGGAIMIQGGDFRQCLPIEEYSLVSEQVNLSVKRSKLWPYFTVMKLTKNLRLNQGQEEYAKWILEVGEGKRLTGLDGQERLWDKIIFRGDLLSEVYGRLLDGDPTLIGPQLQKYLGGRCILSPLNKICDWYNDAIIERLAGQSREYTSVDAICADSDSDQRRHPVNLLNAVDIAGFPPHKLRLKRNTVLMVLRNISPSKGIVNGTRMILMDMRANVLLCRILNGSHAGEVCEIPRITLKYEGTQYPFKFTRHQFPVRVAFAMSVNKSQGQTLDFVGADLRHESFSHGQLYVILSRVRSADNIRIVCNAGSDSTKNIVIKEIL